MREPSAGKCAGQGEGEAPTLVVEGASARPGKKMETGKEAREGGREEGRKGGREEGGREEGRRGAFLAVSHSLRCALC